MERKKRANAFNTGIAAEYFVLSQLYRLGVEAYISQGNKKSIDIRVINSKGNPISIDVKSVRGYSSLVVNNVVSKKDHFVVFVVFNNKFEQLEIFPDVFIVPSRDVLKVRDEFQNEKKKLLAS